MTYISKLNMATLPLSHFSFLTYVLSITLTDVNIHFSPTSRQSPLNQIVSEFEFDIKIWKYPAQLEQ